MKKVMFLVFVLILIVFITGCTQKNETSDFDMNSCEELSKNFDEEMGKISSGYITECDKWESEGKEPMWVGGILIDISQNYEPSYERYGYMLTFQGFEKQYNIYITSQSETIPYKINQFYRFDLSRICGSRFSAASSGAFYDPDFTALEPFEC